MVPLKQDGKRHVVLVGGGHAHLYMLKKLQRFTLPNTHVSLISPDPYQYYSGMFAGYVEGYYRLEDIRVHLARLCKEAGITFICASAEQIEAKQQWLSLSNGDKIHYDVLSFNIGSGVLHTTQGLTGEDDLGLIKPNYRFPLVVKHILKRERVVVVGGGASGIEMSLALQARRNTLKMEQPVRLIHSGALLEKEWPKASSMIAEIMEDRGIQLLLHQRVSEVDHGRILLESGTPMDCDGVVWLTGPAAPSVFRLNGVPVSQDGYLLVNDQLQSTAYPNIFGAGDCVSLRSYPKLAKVGVYAVREAPILWENIQAVLKGKKLKKFQPQSHYLSILSTGYKQALLLYRGVALHAGWCWRLKRQIDVSFIRNYQL